MIHKYPDILLVNSLEEFTTKSKLRKILKVSKYLFYKKTIGVAMCLRDFEIEYPVDRHTDDPITSHPLTRYQCWVIYQILQLKTVGGFPNLMEVENLKLFKDVEQFLSKDRFLQLSEKFSAVSEPSTQRELQILR